MSKPVRILIVEDEFITLDTLRDNLEEMGYVVSGDAMSAPEALEVLERGTTDLAILDIQLKGPRSGIWLAEQIQDRYAIPFIFLTAYSDKQTISAAAETQPASYLVKPFTQPDLYAAIELALLTYARSRTGPGPADTDLAAGELLIDDSIFIKQDGVFSKIVLRDIYYIEAFKNYLELHLAGSRHVIRSTLKELLAVLPETYFLQPHRSFVVNVEKIDRIEGNSLRVGTADIPISRGQRDEVLARLRFFG